MLLPFSLPRLAVLALVLLPGVLGAQPASPSVRPTLSVDQIMQTPATWLGTSPTGIFWAPDGRTVYFRWNPARLPHDSLYQVAPGGGTPQPVPAPQAAALPTAQGTWDAAHRQLVYTRNGDLFLREARANSERRLTLTSEAETEPAFLGAGPLLTFRRHNNLFLLDPRNGSLTQLCDLRGGDNVPAAAESAQRALLKRQQLALFDVLRQRELARTTGQAYRKRLAAYQPHAPKPVYIGEQEVEALRVSPDGRYVTYRLVTPASAGERLAQVPAFVTAGGYSEDTPTRSKVGDRQARFALGIFDRQRDSAYLFSAATLPGLRERPAYRATYPTATAKDTARPARALLPFGPFWSRDGRHALLTLRALDNKDRWLVLLDPATGAISKTLDRQHDDAWIGGPGIDDADDETNLGWLPVTTGAPAKIWFQSEVTGWAHLYTLDVATGARQALTSGAFEVMQAVPTRNGQWFYIITNESDPGEKQLWRLPQAGGRRERLTTQRGAYEIVLSPDEKTAAARFSDATHPWELVTFDLKPGARPRLLTHSTTPAWEAYPWRAPQLVTFAARDGQPVRARLYRPEASARTGAAVIFVHGAGYLQNAHQWWSHYFREYQFHNLLADQGYTVLDVDYRGSAGYGRAFRTGIYRHMGGADLNDEVDAARWLVSQEKADGRRIGIYGGSYGGFLTLMALFTQPEVFACGAALRSVTDWAHYNHGYTSNILNEPQTDSVAYRRSSPIYFAEGLTKPLLICHGMGDLNVHFQDVVRLSQRLIELRKPNWELAVYPVEDHAFAEPTSWADEYRRILKLFDTHLKPAAN